MAIGVCAYITTDGYIKAQPYEPLENCTFTVVSYDEYSRMLSTVNLEFQIDKSLFADITGYLLLSFVSGHILGRIVKTLGKG